MTWLPWLAAIVGTGGVAGVVGSLVTGLVNRPQVRADAVKLLTDAAVQQVNEMQEETSRMRAEVVEARAEVAEARRHVRLLSVEVDACMAKLRLWRTAILRHPSAPDDLRAMVTGELNGHDLH